jgi:hypothetical protein
MQRALKDVDPLLPFNTFRTVDDLRGEALRLPRAAAMLFTTLAGLAVLLSSIGLYGIVAASIGDRARPWVADCPGVVPATHIHRRGLARSGCERRRYWRRHRAGPRECLCTH